ncbi:MAG: DUF362 domain-containing protein [Candidatus Bathyarchaeota archaeon]|nr:DUF362 domain-containing protein [Candidatus Bathyarchaeota archaeon]
MELPKMVMVEQRFDPRRIEDIPAEVAKEIARLRLEDKIKRGDTVAVTAGSRGIANIDTITKAAVDELKKLGALPFIFPAMGSHGGATAEGQARILEKYGITESSMGCPIRSSMEVEYLGDAGDGYPIHVDRHAMEADHIVVVNRVKPHTKFEGPLESGLMKMMAIGMGKQKGAEYYHKAAVKLTFQRIIETVGLEVIRRCPILFGLGIVENGYEQTCLIRALLPGDILEGEKALLVIAKERMARLPFDEIDVLVIDRMGKDISGTGMDTNVTGRNRDILGDYVTSTRVKRIFVRDLTDASDGNAVGIGFADFTTARLVSRIDRGKTYINCLTGISPEKGAIPMYFDADRDALEACFATIGDIPVDDVRLVHIESTLHLSRLSCSRAFEREITERPDLRLMGGWREMALDDEGNMVSPFDQ